MGGDQSCPPHPPVRPPKVCLLLLTSPILHTEGSHAGFVLITSYVNNSPPQPPSQLTGRQLKATPHTCRSGRTAQRTGVPSGRGHRQAVPGGRFLHGGHGFLVKALHTASLLIPRAKLVTFPHVFQPLSLHTTPAAPRQRPPVTGAPAPSHGVGRPDLTHPSPHSSALREPGPQLWLLPVLLGDLG